MEEDKIFYVVVCPFCCFRWQIQKGEIQTTPDHEPIGGGVNNPFNCLGVGKQGKLTGDKIDFNPLEEII